MVDLLNVVVIWRDKHLNVDVNQVFNVQEFGNKLQKLTNVKPDTLRLIVPQSRNKGSKMISPFSEEYSSLSLLESSILEGKPIRMMGAIDSEVKEVSESSMKSDTRIIGFEEEEKRLRQRSTSSSRVSLKLPQGTYVFCEFRTLQLPGIELNPPPSEALRRMHMLACDPGIIAIMNKHKWSVGIMTEMAPVGYVGISPVCLLGFNKNHGEEISLRLRTDDLKGFRKYERIKKTLLHELAHMVYSEHDANFFALDKQLNEEATSLDWTKSASHSLTGRKISSYEDDLDFEAGSYNAGITLGGNSNPLPSARASSAVAAYNRFLNSSSEEHNQPSNKGQLSDAVGLDPSDQLKATPDDRIIEPSPADTLIMKDYANIKGEESHPDDMLRTKDDVIIKYEEPDIDDSITGDSQPMFEPDPDNSTLSINTAVATNPLVGASCSIVIETEPENSLSTTEENYMKLDHGNNSEPILSSDKAEPNTDMDGLETVEDPVSAISSRIQIAIKKLRSEAPPVEASSVIQTLVKIIRNVMEHPNEVKFKRLRKKNPLIQRNVVNYEAAMEVLKTIGFYEDVIPDNTGRKETYLVLKRDDPGLLWLAKTSLEISMA